MTGGHLSHKAEVFPTFDEMIEIRFPPGKEIRMEPVNDWQIFG